MIVHAYLVAIRSQNESAGSDAVPNTLILGDMSHRIGSPDPVMLSWRVTVNTNDE